MKNIRLTSKELARADGDVTIVVRPSSNGGFIVTPVKVSGDEVMALDEFIELAEDRASLKGAIKEANRWMDKCGLSSKMTSSSRHRK